MRLVGAAALALAALPCLAQEQEIQRALIQRDQMTAEFAAGVRASAALQELHARQLREVMLVPLQPELRPYQRQRMADERALVLAAPKALVQPPEKPLPLPGGPRHGVDPIPVQGVGP